MGHRHVHSLIECELIEHVCRRTSCVLVGVINCILRIGVFKTLTESSGSYSILPGIPMYLHSYT